MKLLFYSFCALALLVRSAAAQTVTNGNFETWAAPATTKVEAPANWLTADLILAYFNQLPASQYFDTKTVTKSTDAHSGSFAASLNTLTLQNNNGGSIVFPGFMVLGSRPDTLTIRGLPNAGSPAAARPAQMQLYYKYTGPASDSASVLVYFTSTAPGGVPAIIGASLAYFSPSTTYTALTLPIQYAASALPDSVHIQLSSGDAAKLTSGAKLLVDDITFSGTALAMRADASLQAQLTVSPNPSPAGRFVISSPATPELAAAPLTVLDALGREVLRQPAQAAPTAERTLDLSNLALGIYLLRLDSKQGMITRQLVVK